MLFYSRVKDEAVYVNVLFTTTTYIMKHRMLTACDFVVHTHSSQWMWSKLSSQTVNVLHVQYSHELFICPKVLVGNMEYKPKLLNPILYDMYIHIVMCVKLNTLTHYSSKVL